MILWITYLTYSALCYSTYLDVNFAFPAASTAKIYQPFYGVAKLNRRDREWVALSDGATRWTEDEK